MSMIKAVCMVLGVGFLLSCPVTTRAVDDDIVRLATALCDYAKHDNRTAMRKRLMQSRLDLGRIFDGIRCPAKDGFEGGDVLRTATYFGAFRTARFIVLKIGTDGLRQRAEDGKNVLQWTEALAASGGGKAGDLTPFIELYRSRM